MKEIDNRFVKLYAFLSSVRHYKELSKERCEELEKLFDLLFFEVEEIKK